MALISLLLPCLLFVSYAAVAVLAQDCVYTIYVQTGTLDKAGTDSKISLSLYNEQGEVVSVDNLENWGIMERGHDYFENGHLDIFSGKYKCFSSPVCKMNVTSDGAHAYAEWYLNYIEVATLNPGAICYHQKFEVNQWLADNKPPYKLWASKDYCPKALDSVIQTRPAM